MDFKVAIKCEVCKCTFELRPVEFKDRDAIACPNCGLGLDQSVFSHLRSGIVELAKVPDRVPEDADPFSEDKSKEPQFSLSVKEYNSFIEYDLSHED